MSKTTYSEFLRCFCKLDNPIDIRIVEVDIESDEIKFMVQLPSSPGGMLITQSISSLIITKTQASSIEPRGLFKVDEVNEDDQLEYNVKSLEKADWKKLYGSIIMTQLFIYEDYHDKLFPVA